MKFANLTVNSEVVNNIGENMQIMAIDNLYSYMGINLEDVVRIDYMHVHEYDGEYVVLPINWYFHKFFKNGTQNPFSRRIIPVFLGVSFMSNVFSPEEISFLKENEPIGCRDEWTFNNLRKLNIDAYFNGCMTSLFPKRIDTNDAKKVFCVDVPNELMQYIPNEIKQNAEFVTHVFEGKIEDIDNFTRKVYERYKKEARLIITSRLHCASPCLAAGIPVVLAIKQCIYTLGWIERYIPIYTIEQFDEIDWNPSAVEYENIKTEILENAKNMVLRAFHRNERMRQISYYFENRQTDKKYIIPTVTPVIEFINTHFNINEHREYAFWGITGIADMIYEYIHQNYPQMKLKKVYDKEYTRNKLTYKEISSDLPSNIKNDDLFVFVTAYSATEEARIYFEKINKKQETYCLCCDMKKSF